MSFFQPQTLSTPSLNPRRGLVRSALLVAIPWLCAQSSAAAEEELLVIFTGKSDSAIATEFEQAQLPALKTVADELGVPVKVMNVAQGAPEEVRITPLLVHQSAKGRSFFQGRYADGGKVKHFIRTSRAVPATSESKRTSGVSVWAQGRSRVYAPLKITDLAGAQPKDFDNEEFRRRAERAVAQGFRLFEMSRDFDVGPSDRAFYMDFYPYRSEDGGLYVSLGLFSQFNCIDPVYTRFDSPISGSFEQMDLVFQEAARVLESEVAHQIKTSAIGDGFDPVPTSVASKSWEDLGLALPERSAATSSGAVGSVADLPRRWRIAESVDGAPRLIFRFPSPLERYSGEVGKLSGSLKLGDGNQLSAAQGWISAETQSVTMGEPSLDDAIHQKMIKVAKFPNARFDLGQMSTGTEELAFGRSSRLQAEGAFQLMGLEIPVSVRGEVEPVFDDEGNPLLHVRAAFDIRLSEPFGIAGPDGPEPARDTLKFHLDFLMEADS